MGYTNLHLATGPYILLNKIKIFGKEFLMNFILKWGYSNAIK